MSRWKAFAIHLAASALLLAVLAAVMAMTWYSEGVWQFSRATRLWALVAVVVVVIGPILTLIVFRHGKPRLRFDLACIVVLQLAFLAWGLHAVWASRPVYLVALPHKLTLIFANDIPEDDFFRYENQQEPSLPWFGPELVGVRLPDDPERSEQFLMQTMMGRDLTTFPELYVDFAELKQAVANSARPLAVVIEDVSAAERSKLQAIASANPATNLLWVPLTSSRGSGLAALDFERDRIVQVVPVGVPQSEPTD